MLDRTVRLRIRTRERRYIVEDAAALEAVLRAQGPPVEYVAGRPETEITTIYADTAEGTWTQGLSQTKIRARSYQDPEHWWLELKRRQNERVDKWRRPLPAAAVLENLALCRSGQVHTGDAQKRDDTALNSHVHGDLLRRHCL